MGNDHRGGVVRQGLADHFPRMHAGAVDSSGKALQTGATVAIIEEQAAKDYLLVACTAASGHTDTDASTVH